MAKGRWGVITLGQLRLMDCSLVYSEAPPLRIDHTWVADGTGKVWCKVCLVKRHPDYDKRRAALDERLDALRSKTH